MDTDVASYIFKRDSRARLYAPLVAGHAPILSFMTVAELRLLGRSRDWGTIRRDDLEAYIKRYVIADCDDPTCEAWAEVSDSARRKGRPIQVADAWIAARALVRLPARHEQPKRLRRG